MTIKKLTVIATAAAVLLAGAIAVSMELTKPNEMELEVAEQHGMQVEQAADGSHTLGNMENIPLYYDDADVLLLPLRNVMEGLGGTVQWNAETKETEISYRGRKLSAPTGALQAKLNGYDVTLPAPLQKINGCLYADETVLTAYFTGDVIWNTDSKQITLQTKDSTVPVVAKNTIMAEKDGRAYELQVPVIVGLNDVNYEKSLNKELYALLQDAGNAFIGMDVETTEKVQEETAADTEAQAESAEQEKTEEPKTEPIKEDGLLKLTVQSGYCDQQFVSVWFEGKKDGTAVKFARNMDLLNQKMVTLADMLSEAALAEVKEMAGEGWSEDRFYISAEGGLVLLKGSEENSLEMHHWTTEGKQPEWNEKYKELFVKK